MADPPPYPETDEDAEERLVRPRWAPVAIICGIVLVVLLLVVLHLSGVVGPGSH